MKQIIILFFNVLLVSGCSTPLLQGPSILKTYSIASERNQIAVLRLEQKKSFNIVSCDGLPVPNSARYVLLQPGRHELYFTISESNFLLGGSDVQNKKYLMAEGGRTYILQVKRTRGEQYPEVVDVTNDQALHVESLPSEETK